MTAPQRALIVCPGRGTYTANELGYLAKRKADPRCTSVPAIVETADRFRKSVDSKTVTEIDAAERFSAGLHMSGPNAGSLIFTCSAADFVSIPQDRFKPVAVCGNSMGWYTSLFASGAFEFGDALRLVDTMSKSQQGQLVGGQLIIPWVDEDWQPNYALREQLLNIVKSIDETIGACALSINLGGYLVLAGDKAALAALREQLPTINWGGRDYPFQLAQHAAFHTSLMEGASAFGRERLNDLPWQAPKISLIDGSGRIHRPLASDYQSIFDYTLGEQVLETYDFTLSLRVALREFAPDVLILLGPGTTLGGSVGQTLVLENWQGIHNKADFAARQKSDKPILLAMGRDDQFEAVLG
ncbi:MAG: [acyl-carrier-protein] S-malonyltransferase [Planctomycetota bacterium]|jgi:[acyl-carrier-protein] S-malonyltransferase